MKKYDRTEADAADKNIYFLCFIDDQVIIAKDKDVAACTRCDNLIPGMALGKQNLITCALVAAVAFEILSL
jgi:hypothetical protein